MNPPAALTYRDLVTPELEDRIFELANEAAAFMTAVRALQGQPGVAAGNLRRFADRATDQRLDEIARLTRHLETRTETT